MGKQKWHTRAKAPVATLGRNSPDQDGWAKVKERGGHMDTPDTKKEQVKNLVASNKGRRQRRTTQLENQKRKRTSVSSHQRRRHQRPSYIKRRYDATDVLAMLLEFISLYNFPAKHCHGRVTHGEKRYVLDAQHDARHFVGVPTVAT